MLSTMWEGKNRQHGREKTFTAKGKPYYYFILCGTKKSEDIVICTDLLKTKLYVRLAGANFGSPMKYR